MPIVPVRADPAVRQPPSFAYYGPPSSPNVLRRPPFVHDIGFNRTYSNHGSASTGDPPSFARYGAPSSVDENTLTFYAISETTDTGVNAVVVVDAHPPPRYKVTNVP